MRRIALCLYGLVLVLPMFVGCKKEEPAPAPKTDTTTPATPAEEPAK
jgi:hypothetical protein